MKLTLNDVADIRGGYAFRGRIEHDPASDLAVLTIKDVEPNGDVRDLDLMKIDSASIDKIERYLLQPGDVLFQSRGSRNLSMWVNEGIYAIPAQGLYWLRPKKGKVTGAYLAWYLNHKNCLKNLSNLSQGTQIPLIPREEFKQFPIHVPSMEEQQKIVDITSTRIRQKRLQQQLDACTDQLIETSCWQRARASK